MVNTTVCTFQKVAIEKEEVTYLIRPLTTFLLMQTYSPVQGANGKYLFDIKNSPFCDYMVSLSLKV